MKLLLNLALLFLGASALIGLEYSSSTTTVAGTTNNSPQSNSPQSNTDEDNILKGEGGDLSIYKSYYKSDYKVVVTSPGFWTFPEKELTTVLFNVSAPNEYNSSRDMITTMEQVSAQSSQANLFKAVLQFNRELDTSYFDAKKRYIESDSNNDFYASTDILGLYYYLVEGDASCNPSQFYTGRISINDTINNQGVYFQYPEGIRLKSESSQSGYELSSYPIDLTLGTPKSGSFGYKSPVFTLYDVYTAVNNANDVYINGPGDITQESVNALRKSIVENCLSFQEEVENIQNRELSDTETIELEGGITATKELYARGKLEDMVFSFTTLAPIDWENIGLSIEFDIGVYSCTIPLPSEQVVAESSCIVAEYLNFNKNFGRENINLISNPAGNEHKLRLFFKNNMSDNEYDILSKSIEALVLNAQYSGSGSVKVKLHAVKTVETQDGDNNTIFNTSNDEVLYWWIFDIRGSSIVTPTQEKVN